MFAGVLITRLGLYFTLSKAVAIGVLYKKLFLNITQYSRENTCARVSF